MNPRRHVPILLALLAAACATPPAAPPGGEARLHTFVVLGPEGRTVARAVTTAADCPSLEVDGVAQPMDVRATAETLPLRPGQAKPSAFPVRVCERTLPATATRASIAGRALALPKASPQRIVVIGDTGCRLYAPGGAFQPCNDPAQWPFATLAQRAAATRPDLVIHVGDYHYRETACLPGDAGCAGSPWGYGFDTWDADFFVPAGALLAAAPWIVVRGNHEMCTRAGQGWWRLLDPRPLSPQQDCNIATNDAIGEYSEPYAVLIGTNQQVVVFDSASAGNTPIDPDGVTFATYRAQLIRAFASDAGKTGTLFLAHHPPLAFAANPGDPASPYKGNPALLATLAAVNGGSLFPPTIAAVLSGHIHAFEAVTFKSAQPPQLVAGMGGTATDAPLPMPFPRDLSPAPRTVVDELVYTNRFGFMTMDRAGADWTLRAWDAEGRLMSTCTLAGRRATCSPIALP